MNSFKFSTALRRSLISRKIIFNLIIFGSINIRKDLEDVSL